MWSAPDGVRTVPAPVLFRHAPVSVTAAKDAARARRWAVSPSPSLRDVRAAAEAMHATGQMTFTRVELGARLAADGAPWTAKTVQDLLNREVRAPYGRLERVRVGHYRLRSVQGRPAAMSTGSPVVEHVRAALTTLTAGGQVAVTSRQVADAMAATGVAHTPQAVRAGLRTLRHAQPPVVVRTPDGRYRLAAGQGGGRDECAPGSGRHAGRRERREVPGDDPMSAR